MKNLLTKVLLVSILCFIINPIIFAQTIPDSIKKGDGESGFDYGYGTDDALLVTVGSQTWFAKNLNIAHFANGDPIPEAKTEDEWKRAGENKQPAWCYYNNDPANGFIYGRLYNWYAVNDPRGLAPSGWHIPSDSEWDIMIKHLAGNDIDVNKPTSLGNETYYITEEVGTSLKSTNEWKKKRGSNTSGFSGLPGGNRLTFGPFKYLHQYGSWWSSSENGSDKAWYRGLYYDNGKVNRFAFYKSCGFSVRCIKD